MAPPRDRVYAAIAQRSNSDYVFNFWTALGWTVLTLSIYGYYVFYQLVRRVRDHRLRRIELFDAALTFAWEQAETRGLQDELTPSFQRAASHMGELNAMSSDFRDPAIWTLIALFLRGITEVVAFVFLDQDLVRHDRAEVGVEYELSVIYGRLGQPLASPDVNRVKGENNYVARVIVAFVTLGIYMFWWTYNQMEDFNRHFEVNWLEEDALAQAVANL